MTESYTAHITLSLMDRERKSLVGVWAILFVATLSFINFLIDPLSSWIGKASLSYFCSYQAHFFTEASAWAHSTLALRNWALD